MNLNDDPYDDFGKWNSLEFSDGTTSEKVLIPAHSGDFFPETPEDYIEIIKEESHRDWPVRADIDITNRCNHKCPFCFSQFQRSLHPHLDFDEQIFKHTVDELILNGTISIRFCGGGEPLMHPNALELMSYVLNRSVHVTLLTNGDLFAREFQSIFLRPYTYVRFSVDSHDSQTRRESHGANVKSFDNLIENISGFNRARNQSSIKNKTKVGATYLIHRDQVDGLFGIAKLLKNIGVDHLAFRQIKGGDFSASLTEKEDETIRKELLSIKKSLGDENFQIFVTQRNLYDSNYPPRKYFRKCLVCRTRIIIEADGAVQMCPRARGERSWRTLGIISHDTNLAKIWNSRNRIVQEKNAPNECSDCIDISSNRTLNDILTNVRLTPSSSLEIKRVSK